MEISPSTDTDLQQIAEWQTADPWRTSLEPPSWWLTGNDCFLAGKVADGKGSVAYFRVHDEGDTDWRIWALFGPESVSLIRKARAISWFTKMMIQLARVNEKNLVTQSDNPDLLDFLVRLGFQRDSDTNVIFTMEQN